MASNNAFVAAGTPKQVAVGPGTLTSVLSGPTGTSGAYASLYDTASGVTSGTQIAMNLQGSVGGLDIQFASGLYVVVNGSGGAGIGFVAG